ncbi:MAG: DUF1574 domain-containing protein [Lachnospiraceae bacterium]|nr:DUF1574 domain-containing protein [Lachnospiraceae bacterium]
MKKYILRFIFLLFITGVIFASINMIIDPYNIFHYENPRNNGVEANKNYIKTKYILNHPDKFDSFIFGSSRAGFMNSYDIPGGHYYNMCSSEAVPAEHLRILKIFLKNGIIPKNVIVMVDDIACFVDPKNPFHDQLYRVAYPDDDIISKAKFYYRYCDLITTFEALEVMLAHEDDDPEYLERYKESGSERMDKKASDVQGDFSEGYWSEYYSLRVEEAVKDMADIRKLCDENGINLIVMTNPTYFKTYALGVERGYINFLEALAEVTDYWNFSSFSDITVNEAYYYETSHFTPEVTKMMVDMAISGKKDDRLWSQGFGIHVTEENKEEFIAFLKNQAEEYGVKCYE